MAINKFDQGAWTMTHLMTRMGARRYEDSITLRLLKARETAMGYFRPLLQENSLTEQQWRVIRALYHLGEQDIKKLAEICSILSPSMVGILKRLEQRGFVKRRTSSEDQRRTLVTITPRSVALFEKMSPEIEKRYAKLYESFPKSKLQELEVLLDELSKVRV